MNCIPPRHTTNVVKNNVVVTKTAPVLCLVIFHQYEPLFTPTIPTNFRRQDHSAVAGQCISRLPSPKTLYQCPLGASNKFQNAHNQRAVLSWNPNFLSILKVMTCQLPVMEQVKPTRITTNQDTNCLQSRTTA